MNVRTKFKSFIIIALAATAIAQAQTVNNGVLVVSPGTIMSTEADFSNTGEADFLNDGEVYFYANFNNDGLVDFDPQFEGFSRFQGFGVQKITGTMPSSFKHVLFYNSTIQPAFQLFGDINIYGNSEFNQGILNNDDFGGTITFEKEATHSSTWNGSHVDGSVIKKGNTEFQYPIGDKNRYRYARISAPSELISSFTGKYFFENSDAIYAHTNKQPQIELIDNKEYWTIEKTNGTSDVLLTLSWDETATTPAEVVANEADIHIVRWDTTQNMWVDEGGVADAANKTVTTAVEVSGYGVFTLAKVKSTVQPSCIKIYNAVTPNADNINDYFLIECINNYPKNTVQIFNRWGVKVFDTKGYDSSGNVFRGFSDGRTTVDGSNTLPTGTYFYILTYDTEENGKSETHKQAGYLYLNVK